MNAAITVVTGTSLHKGIQRAVHAAVVLAILATTTSSVLAASSPVQAYAVSGCQAALVQATIAQRIANPPLAGVALLSSETGRYDLWHPADWNVSSGVESSILLPPAGQHQGAAFSISVMDTPNAMTSDDLVWRITWFDRLISALPGAQVEWQDRSREGNVTAFDARYTYEDGDNTVWRRVRLLYAGTRQYWMVAEARSEAEYDSLQPMFLTMLVTFRPQEQVDAIGVDMCVA
jgi:hypothetical protein